MVGTITFGGIGSGMDTESIVSALVNVERTGQNALAAKLSATQSSISNLSSVSSLLAKLKSAAEALDTTTEVGSYKASSSGNAIVASANGLATPGKYSITVEKLAKEQRTYSNTISSATTALGQSGTLQLKVGTGTATDIAIAATDKLDDVIGKINSAGLKVTASSFFDGTSYRIQLRGQESGAANALTITETGTTFGFNATGNTVQAAQDARIKLDGFTVTSATNQVTGAIRGVTLALTAESPTDPITVSVENDPAALKTKLTALVDTYNAVIGSVKSLAGNGGIKASDEVLAGDSTLRSITSRLSAALQNDAGGSSAYKTLSSIGLSLDRTGRLSLDSTKFDKALAADSEGVTRVLSGTDATKGVMDVVASTVDAFTAKDKGLLTARSEAFTKRVKLFQERIDREEVRINRYGEQLRKQFTAMDTQVASWNQQSSYLSSYL
jgi:flagellar hook-associated protein 2